jgi:hypothetical protein
MKGLLWTALLALVLSIMVGVAACGGTGGAEPPFTVLGTEAGAVVGTFDATIPPVITPPGLLNDGAPVGDGGETLAILPQAVTLAVTLGTTPSIPTQKFTATYGGVPVGAQFTVDRGELGSVGVGTGLFTPGGSLGGVANVTATYQGLTVTATVNIKITYIGVGDPNPPDAGGGAGGFGGVGGAGEGPPATPAQVTTLNGAPTADAALGFLYPYDGTVFPQAVLPPLLQWSIGTHSFDAVRIHITETNYEYKGYFQKPGTPFQNHPLPQAVWNALAYSNAGEPVNVELVFSEGTSTIGPITETWKIAQGELKGTIYYNSYGTNLASNNCCTLADGGSFGGATLAIKEGALDPVLIAGSSGGSAQCRVCHSVSANGSTLLTQHGDNGYAASSTYALTNNDVETTVPSNNDGRFTYPALSPDGTMMFTHESTSALYAMNGTAVPGVTGIPAGLSAFTPAFSPDGKHVAFNFAGGATPNGVSLASIDFAPATKAFSNVQTLTPGLLPDGGTSLPAYWPSFLPTNTGIVFDVETLSNGRDTAGTRSQCDTPSKAQGGDGTIQPTNPCHSEGTHAELWWVDVASKTATRLDKLNGKGYLPPHPTYTGANGDDSTLNYEPTVNPVPSGGYAWVVFTSRRLYGNVATVNPYWSDPRFENISQTPTTKKLWVAAIDLNAAPGTDPSHPAFYLPAQELMAGNSRGFWVVDPCQADGTSCLTGDECCGGYCRPGTDGGLTCTATQPSCAQEFEKCATTADCCGASVGIQCINDRCAQTGPK